MEIRRAAPAKLNLYLHVLGRRPDFYHRLDSLVAFADIADLLIARPADALSLDIRGIFAAELAGDPTGNLVWRAAVALAERAGIAPRATLVLEKNLPIASGIGGGSSDAAATLQALAELWQLDLQAPRFGGLGQSLGADVPVCLYGRAAWLGGIGEEIAPAPKLPPVPIVVVNPGSPLPTPAVFKARQGAFSAPARFDETPRDAAGLATLLKERANDLTPAAIGLVPAIAEVLADLEDSEGALLARMSGSGATCFALYGEEAQSRRAAALLARQRPRWWVAAGRLI